MKVKQNLLVSAPLALLLPSTPAGTVRLDPHLGNPGSRPS